MHQLTLNDPWFDLVLSGKKLYEGRKYSNLFKINDVIEFTHHTDKTRHAFKVLITSIRVFPTFKEALQTLPIEQILPLKNITIDQGIEIYKKYVSLSTQTTHGVIMKSIDLSDGNDWHQINVNFYSGFRWNATNSSDF